MGTVGKTPFEMREVDRRQESDKDESRDCLKWVKYNRSNTKERQGGMYVTVYEDWW